MGHGIPDGIPEKITNKKSQSFQEIGIRRWRRRRDSNSRTVSRRRFSRPLPSATRPPLRNGPNYKQSTVACKACLCLIDQKAAISISNDELIIMAAHLLPSPSILLASSRARDGTNSQIILGYSQKFAKLMAVLLGESPR